MQTVTSFEQNSWESDFSHEEQEHALESLEGGKILLLPKLDFTLQKNETCFLTPHCLAPKAKNVSYDSKLNRLSGFDGSEADFDKAELLMQRFVQSSKALVKNLLPQYMSFLTVGRTSFRPAVTGERHVSYRKDDRLLHVDAFPATPVRGMRILRVFTNVNPEGVPRIWNVGEPFEQVVKTFLPHIPKPFVGKHSLMRALQITKKKRSLYDHYMMKIHNSMKKDSDYQKRAIVERLEIPSGATWVVFSDQVSHAALSGQYMFEQTFYLPVNAMKNQATAPLRVLESYLGKKLT